MKYLNAIKEFPGFRDEKEIETGFRSLAEALLCHTSLVIGNTPYEILEVEAYYHSPLFPDPFTHKNVRQLVPDQWYLHRKGEGLKNGNYKGLDLTFGGSGAWGGFLLRAIRPIGGEAIDGPCLLVNEVMAKLSVPHIRELALVVESKGASDPKNQLRLVEKDSKTQVPFTASPRVGLTLKDDPLELRLKYLARFYRFRREPALTREDRNTIFLALIQQGLSLEDAAASAGVRGSNAQKYLESFKRGREHQRLPPRDQNLGVNEQCELMGTLAVLNGNP
jgi:hypothetical protein